MKRVQKNKSKRKYQKGGVKKSSSKKITVGSSLNPWTLYSGKNPELQYPLKVKEKVEKEKLKKEMKKLKKKQSKVRSNLKSAKKKIKKTGLPLEKKRRENPELLRTREENRILAEIDSPWGF